jgi:hypothetical protein
MEVSGEVYFPVALPRVKSPRTLWTGGWVDLRAGQDAVEKKNNLPLFGREPRSPGSVFRRFVSALMTRIARTWWFEYLPDSDGSKDFVAFFRNSKRMGVLRFLLMEFSVQLRLSGMSRVECWKISNVSANISVAIFRVNVY